MAHEQAVARIVLTSLCIYSAREQRRIQAVNPQGHVVAQRVAQMFGGDVGTLGGESLTGAVDTIRAEGDGLVVSSEAGEHYACAVIVASGAKIKRLGIPGEAELEGQGVSQCAECDGPLFHGKDVVVVGGGDSALQEALAVAQFARRVHLLHRGDAFRARRQFVDAVAAEPKISVRFLTEVSAIAGSQGVAAVQLKGGGEIACAGFFAYPGLEPVCGFLPRAAARDARQCHSACARRAMPCHAVPSRVACAASGRCRGESASRRMRRR